MTKKTTVIGNILGGIYWYGVVLIGAILSGIAFNVFLTFAGF
jgi:hypothetical protein